jgi:hypothetical protein
MAESECDGVGEDDLYGDSIVRRSRGESPVNENIEHDKK